MVQDSAAKEVTVFAKKSKSNVVMTVMDMPLKDPDEERTIGTATKKDISADYEPFMKHSAEKRRNLPSPWNSASPPHWTQVRDTFGPTKQSWRSSTLSCCRGP